MNCVTREFVIKKISVNLKLSILYVPKKQSAKRQLKSLEQLNFGSALRN